MMSERSEVLVIGGGVIGVCAAHYLAERGRQVTLVEQGDIASGCSYGNAGLVVPSHSLPLAAPGALASGLKWLLDSESPFYIKPRLDPDLVAWLLRFTAAARPGPMRRAIPVLRDLSMASRALFDELAARDEFDFDYQPKGALLVFNSRRGYEGGKEEAHLLQEYGLAAQILEAAQAHTMEPALHPEVVGAVYFSSDARLNPALFVRGLAALAQKKGACLRTSTEVLGFEIAGRKITTVKTTRGDFQPEQVILAAGSWSPRVARDLHLNLPIQPAKGYSLTVRRPATCPTYPLLLGEARAAITPMRETLRFGGTLELAGLDFAINERRLNAILRAARRYLVDMGELETVEIWRGLRPCTPDGLPIIGRPPAFDNLIVAAGHAMLGMSLGPITGKLVAQIVCGEPPALDLRALRPERFS